VIGLILMLALGIGGATWWSLVKGREQARNAAGSVCREQGLVLMDDTVVLETFQFQKKGQAKGWCLRYRFEFARQGVLHRGGIVLITPGRRPTVVIKLDGGQLIQEILS